MIAEKGESVEYQKFIHSFFLFSKEIFVRNVRFQPLDCKITKESPFSSRHNYRVKKIPYSLRFIAPDPLQ